MDFNEVIDRHGTYCTQWDYAADRFGSSWAIAEDVTPIAPPELVSAWRAKLKGVVTYG